MVGPAWAQPNPWLTKVALWLLWLLRDGADRAERAAQLGPLLQAHRRPITSPATWVTVLEQEISHLLMWHANLHSRGSTQPELERIFQRFDERRVPGTGQDLEESGNEDGGCVALYRLERQDPEGG